METVTTGRQAAYILAVNEDPSGNGPMIIAKTHGLGSLSSLEADGEQYDASAAGGGLLKRFLGQTYSVVERRSGQLKQFAELAESDYQAIRSELVRLTR